MLILLYKIVLPDTPELLVRGDSNSRPPIAGCSAFLELQTEKCSLYDLLVAVFSALPTEPLHDLVSVKPDAVPQAERRDPAVLGPFIDSDFTKPGDLGDFSNLEKLHFAYAPTVRSSCCSS